MLEEGQIKGGADEIFLVLREDDMSAIVARLDGLQYVLRIIFTVSIGFDGASLHSSRGRWEWLPRMMRLDRVLRSLRPSHKRVARLRRR